jgi:uncharacterized cupredoxin-like copper-binding protein
MLALVIIAAVPLLAFASSNIGLQRTVPDDHAGMGHYGFMAAFGFTVIGVGLLASLRPDGWRLTAWVAGLLPALLGLASLVFPDASSSLGPVWALAAIAWGAVFVAAAELTKGVISKDDTRVRPERLSTSGTPGWVKVFGIIALVLVLLGGIIVLTGVGGEHGPSRHISSGDTGGQTRPSSGQENTGGVGGPADAGQAARTVEVTTLDAMTFEPRRIKVSPGETVTFVVTNSGQAVHEFTLGDAAMQQEHAAEMAQIGDAMAHNEPNSITLQPGKTRQLTGGSVTAGRLSTPATNPVTTRQACAARSRCIAMIMSPRLRKFALTVHVTASVGWIGAVAAYIALDVAAATGQDAQTLCGAYLAMELTASFVIVPLAFATLLSGLVMSLWACHVIGHQVGPVPALLDVDFTPANPDCHQSLAGGNADNQLLRRQSSRSDNVQRRSARASEISLWSYADTAAFSSVEEAFEWESVRTSAYRMAQPDLNPASVAAFKRDYLRKAQVKRDQYGILGLTTATLFGVGSKPVRDWYTCLRL